MTTKDHPAYVHANEAIVPLDRYPGLRSFMEREPGGGAGVTVHVQVNVQESDVEEIVAKTAGALRTQLHYDFRHNKRTRDAIGSGQQGSLHT